MGALTIAVAITVPTAAIIPVLIIAVYKTATQAHTQVFTRAPIAADFIQAHTPADSPACAAAMKSITAVRHIQAIVVFIVAVAIAVHMAAIIPVLIIVVLSRNVSMLHWNGIDQLT